MAPLLAGGHTQATVLDTQKAQAVVLKMVRDMRRADCEEGAEERNAGRACCPRLDCKYHLIGALTLNSTNRKRAVSAFESYLAGEWVGHCVLDVAPTMPSDRQIAKMTACESVPSVVRSGLEKMRLGMKE